MPDERESGKKHEQYSFEKGFSDSTGFAGCGEKKGGIR
ncbi:MAG: hypothetical protein HSCHL_2039 [Hydrogenibacillus schlegelii]|uniref:Uncharacterized protein n=1 Tax=Hydrogenibacillus schlegelii TaxID=1484 RepID=A0A2T5G416_HYDSH|nr:MAG: hypothetical protein HSCHL_2039 [Hydrogenibacillus schlegelii]